MKGLSARFFGSAVVYGIAGMTLGNVMGISGDHSQLTTHAHIMLIGWVSFALFGLFYQQFSERNGGLLPQLHFWLAQAGYLILIAGLFLIFSDSPGSGEPLAAIGSVAYLASMILFGFVALPVIAARR
jgi:hypothetical protein